MINHYVNKIELFHLLVFSFLHMYHNIFYFYTLPQRHFYTFGKFSVNLSFKFCSNLCLETSCKPDLLYKFLVANFLQLHDKLATRGIFCYLTQICCKLAIQSSKLCSGNFLQICYKMLCYVNTFT